jgi:hypothetical protein
MNDLKWVKVKSSNLSKVAYDKADKELYVEFKSGSKYSYIDVSNKKFESLLNAESKGTYFSTKIKPNHDYRDWN